MVRMDGVAVDVPALVAFLLFGTHGGVGERRFWGS